MARATPTGTVLQHVESLRGLVLLYGLSIDDRRLQDGPDPYLGTPVKGMRVFFSTLLTGPASVWLPLTQLTEHALNDAIQAKMAEVYVASLRAPVSGGLEAAATQG